MRNCSFYQIPKGIIDIKMLRIRALDRGCVPETLNPCFSKCGVRTRSMGTTWKLFRKAKIKGGGIGRYTVPPCTTKRRTTTNLKTKKTQNCQKIELYESPTNKEWKKHSSRLVGGADMGSQGRRTCKKVAAGGMGRWGGSWWTGIPIHMRISWQEQLGSEIDSITQGSSVGN